MFFFEFNVSKNLTHTLDKQTAKRDEYFLGLVPTARQQRTKAIVLMSLLFCLLWVHQAAFASSGLSYDLNVSGIQGNDFDGIRKTFNAGALLKSSRPEALVSVAKLRGQIRSDADLMHRILRADGYYSGKVSTRLARSGDHFTIELNVAPGARYAFGEITFEFKGPIPEELILEKIKEQTGLSAGGPAIAATFIAAEARLDNSLQALGFPFAEGVQHDLVVDHQTKLLNVTFMLEPGARQRMGVVRYEGNEHVIDTYLYKFADWNEGSYFEQRLVNNLRARLVKSGLFAQVTIKTVPADSDHVDLAVTLTEAPHRTVGATAGYSTAEGFGAEVFWEHRNLFDRGGHFKITARGAEIDQSVAGRLELPNFARLDQTVSLESLFRRQNTDAFLSYEGETRIGVDRVITPNFAVLAGAALEYSDVTDGEGNRAFLLASLPVGVRWDNSNDLLNPSKGIRASLIATPSINLGNTGFQFLKSEFRASTYVSFTKKQNVIVALRTRLGSITGAANDTLPATQRFFAGGGGSIRGFSFQNVGLVDDAGNPLGGRSVAEVAAELRVKLSGDIGIVPFIEGGNTYVSELPNFSDFRWGVGIGARYHTSFGPIRFDLAFPLDRQPGESRLQFYVSLGQAF